MQALRFVVPRIGYVLAAAVFVGVAANGGRLLNFDGDLPRHLLVGDLILRTSQVHSTDIFSFRTAGLASVPHEWLAQVLFAVANAVMGLAGVVLLTAVVLALAFGIVYADAQRRSSSPFASLLVTLLAVGAAALHVLPRPHILTYALLAAWMYLLESLCTGRSRAWWALPVVMLAWANLHGMFVLGVLTWLIAILGALLGDLSRPVLETPEFRRLAAGGLLALIVTSFSPSGLRTWDAVLGLARSDYIISRIPEYRSADFHQPGTWPFVVLLIVALVLLGRSSGEPTWRSSLWLGAFAGLALYSSRMIPIFAVIAAPIVAEVLGRWLRGAARAPGLAALESRILAADRMAGGAVWPAAVVVGIALLFASGRSLVPDAVGNRFDPRFFPVDAVQWLKSNPQEGRVFNDFDWGGYILYELWPAQQIFMDGHTHIYGEDLTREYELVVLQLDGWEAVLAKYEIAWVIIPADSDLVTALLQRGWRELYRDPTAAILRR